MKDYLIISLIAFGSFVSLGKMNQIHASEGAIRMVRECEPEMSACKLYKDIDGSGKTYHGIIAQVLEIKRSEVNKARITKDRGDTIISIGLIKEAAKRLEAFTDLHVNKRVFIVVDDYVLSAPTVREKISGGSIQLMIPEGDMIFTQKLNWLYTLSDETIGKDKEDKKMDLYKYLGIAGILFLGSLAYVFVGNEKKVV